MSKHTPGPWYAAPADEWRTASGEHWKWERFNISARSVDMKAENYYYHIASVSNANNSAQNEANARLISAAPDMLAALLEITERIEGHPAYAALTEQEELDVGGDTAELSYLARVAREAIERATGAQE